MTLIEQRKGEGYSIRTGKGLTGQTSRTVLLVQGSFSCSANSFVMCTYQSHALPSENDRQAILNDFRTSETILVSERERTM